MKEKPPHETAARLFIAARELAKITAPADIARLLNVSDQTINNWTRRGVSREGMLLAQRLIGCSATWLETGEGQMTRLDPQHISADIDISKKSQNSGMITDLHPTNGDRIGKNDGVHGNGSHRDVPRIGDNFTAGPDLRARLYPEISWVQAGMWTEIADNFVPTEETRQYPCHIDLGPDGYVLRVDGLSMTAPPGVFPSFPPGILLYVRPHEDAVPGKHVIVRRNGNTATFKKLTLVDGELFLEALNPDWPHRYIEVQADDVFCGVVMHAGFDL